MSIFLLLQELLPLYGLVGKYKSRCRINVWQSRKKGRECIFVSNGSLATVAERSEDVVGSC